MFAIKMEFLNGCRVGQVHFKDCLTVNSDIYCFACGLKGQALKAKYRSGQRT